MNPMKKPWVFPLSFVLAVLTVAVSCSLVGQVYFEDFESGAGAEWSDARTSVTPCPSKRKFLGEFEGNDSTTLALSGLMPHVSITIEFDLFIIYTWDGSATGIVNGKLKGPDIWGLGLTGFPPIFEATFSNNGEQQTFPNSIDDGLLHDFQSGASETNSLNYVFSDAWPSMDSVYHLSFTIPHTDSDASIYFAARNLASDPGVTESWGLDNVTVFLNPQDSDDDGIPDDEDHCPDSDLSETVVVDGCDSGVANVLLDDGCTISDLLAACEGISANHGAYVSCVAFVTNELKKDGVISGKDKGKIQRCAARSSIGK